MAIGWVANITSADLYFDEERAASSCWDNADNSGDVLKTALLTHAYNRLFYSAEYDLPTYATATAAQLVILRKVQCEMAYYLCQHLEGEDRRKGIQAQAVKQAGIVKESYLESMMMKAPVPAVVDDMLEAAGFKAVQCFGAADLTRDDDSDFQ